MNILAGRDDRIDVFAWTLAHLPEGDPPTRTPPLFHRHWRMRPLPQYGLAEQSALVQPVPTLGGAPGLRRILRQIAFVTSRSLKSTDVFGRRITLEDLIARILRDLREKAEAQFGAKIRTAVAGRPGVLRRR